MARIEKAEKSAKSVVKNPGPKDIPDTLLQNSVVRSPRRTPSLPAAFPTRTVRHRLGGSISSLLLKLRFGDPRNCGSAAPGHLRFNAF